MIFKDNEQCKNQDIILGRVINSQIRDSFAKKPVLWEPDL